MRLSWKLFFFTTPIFILTLALFGTWMINDAFTENLNREIDQCLLENQMFQNSYELAFHALTDEQKEQVPVSRLVKSFQREYRHSRDNQRIYDENGQVLFQENSLLVEHGLLDALLLGMPEDPDEETLTGYQLVKEQGSVYLVAAARSRLGLVMETTRDITRLYAERAERYGTYRLEILIMTALVGALILLVISFLTRDIRRLSDAALSLAKGNRSIRVPVSRGETGRLSESFNVMADTLRPQMERLEGEVRRQEDFTAAFAHELKTPLTSIIGYADTLRQLELPPEEAALCADYIVSQGKRLQALSFKLLDMTMAGQGERNFQRLYPDKLLGEALSALEISLKEKGVIVKTDIQKGAIYGDKALLTSVFINLVDNARKATPPGKRVFLTGRTEPGGYGICVGDEGSGIPQEELGKITEAFYMVDKSRSRKEGGAGLGLALCQRILDLHQAEWHIESRLGEGTTVTVHFQDPDWALRSKIQKE